MSTVSRLYPLSGLAALVLVGCSSQPAQPLKKGKKAVAQNACISRYLWCIPR